MQDANPLAVSPANKDANRARHPEEGAPEASAAESEKAQSGRQRTSGGGSAPKAGTGKYGGS